MEFGMSRRIKPKRKMCGGKRDIWPTLDGPPKNKELCSYVGRKVAQIGPSRC